jgi:misshapen/NIK-related kinase
MSSIERGKQLAASGNNSSDKNNSNNLAFMEKKKIEEMNNKLKLENRVKNAIFTKNNFNSPQGKKLVAENSSDSRFSNFVRGFRRERTDFFPSSKRHSAVFSGEQASAVKSTSPQKVQRSSAIFQRNRPKGEPILTDFIPKRDNTLDKPKSTNIKNNDAKNASAVSQPEVKLRNNQATSSNSNANNLDFHRMRREKTESVIFVSPRNANSAIDAFQQLQLQQVNMRCAKCQGFFF